MNMIPQDKANHFFFGALFALFVAALVAYFGPRVHVAPSAFLAALALGVVKELSDYWSNRKAATEGLPAPHSVEALDAAATAVGGLLVSAACAVGAL